MRRRKRQRLQAQRELQAQRGAEEHHLDKMREKHFIVGQERQCEHCGHDIWYVETTDTLPIFPTGEGPTFDVTSKTWLDRDFEDMCRKRRQIEPGDPWHEPGIGDKEQPGE